MKNIFSSKHILRKMFDIAYADGVTHGSGQTFTATGRYDPYKAFRYLVEITGNKNFAKAGFQKVTGLKMTTDVIEYREGGDPLTVSKTPGLTKFDPITMERGMSEDLDMWDWATKLFDFQIVNQSNSPIYRSNVTIKLLDRNGDIVKVWQVPNAWVSEYSTGDFDAKGNNVMIEKIVLQHEGFYLDKK